MSRIGKQEPFCGLFYLKLFRRLTSGIGFAPSFALAGAGREPVVDRLLRAASGFNSIVRFAFADQGFGLAALGALIQELAADSDGFLFGGGDAGSKCGGVARG